MEGVGPQALAAQQGQDALAEPVRLLQVRIAGQDELVDAEAVVFGDPLGHLGVAAHQGRARAAAHQADTGPEIGVDLEVVQAAAVQGEHALLALGLAAAEAGLDGAHGLRVEAVEQPARLGPRLLGGVAGDDVQPDAEADRTALFGGEGADPGDLLGHLGGRLAPGEVDIGVAGGDLTGGGGGAAEVDLGDRVGEPGQLGALDVEVFPGVIDGLAVPQVADDAQELAGAGVAGLLVEEVAEGALLLALAAGDHVEHQPPAGLPLVGGGHLGGEGGREEAGAEGHQELQPLGVLADHRGGQPGVLAPGTGRGERTGEAEVFGGAGDLGEIADGRRTVPSGRGDGGAMATSDDMAAVAVGGQEPVEGEGHGATPFGCCGGDGYRRPWRGGFVPFST
ncbi:hypothetical protein SVIO_084310 [Streptomyces violaceusniger]|uniref:Uncharacterized protein n=1 Tax=Streptomyces violaceusniger TaxID=68280 RepID=A0A4D4LH50_STRVO|nr:hypothetical protein SVIO_084310 [Streptomyces violaceusniger]